MTKKTKSFLSMVLSLCLLLGSALPVGATEVTGHEHTENAEVVQESVTVTETAEDVSTDISLDASLKNVTVNTDEFSFDVKFDAATVLADPDAEVDENDPVIITLEAELKNITVLDEETGESVALTEEQIQTVLQLYQNYADHWAANADVLGVQTPFFLSYNDDEDGLGVLGEMLVLAGVSVDQVRNGEYSYDKLVGMIQNFTYANVLGVQYYGSAIKSARDEVLALIEESGAKTEAQKLLVLNDWMAHINTFDMPYIMNLKEEDEKPMVAEDPQPHEHYQDVYDVIYGDYVDSLDQQFRQQIRDGLEANFKQQYYSNAIESVVHDMIYAQAKSQAVEEAKAGIQDKVRAEAEAAEKQEIWNEAYDAAYDEYMLNEHEHEFEAEFTWTDDCSSATADIYCTYKGCEAGKTGVKATVTENEDERVEATCQTEGKAVYTATVIVEDEDGETVTLTDSKEKVLPLADHVYDENGNCTTEGCTATKHVHDAKVAFTWEPTEDGYTATATVSCTEECTELSVDNVNVKDTTEEGKCYKSYTATADVKDADGVVIGTASDEKKVPIADATHNYGENDESDVCLDCGYEKPVTPEEDSTVTPEEDQDTTVSETAVVLNASADVATVSANAEVLVASESVATIVLYGLEEDAETYATEKADAAVETDEAKAQITAAGDAAVEALDEETLTNQATEAVENDEEAVAQLEAAADEQTEAYMTENADAISEDPVAFVDSQEMFQTEVPVTNEDGSYVTDEEVNVVTMTIAAQLHAGWEAFWADAEENGVEVDPENAPGYKMTIDEIVEQQMDTAMDDLPEKEDGTHMTPNEAVPVYAAQAAAGLTDGVINYWEGSQFGALGFGTSVCLGYTKAFTYLVQCMHPEIYLKDGATDIDNAENWKTAQELYYDEDGNLDINQNYVVDAVRITFDASVTMYGETEDNFNSDHFWNAVKVDGQWYYIDPCYTDVFTEVMMRDRVETDGSMNHLYFLFSHSATVELYDGNYKEIKTLYENAATDTSYEDSWISRIKSNTYFDGGYAYYLYDSTDMLTMMEEYENQNSEADIEDSVYKLVRHELTSTDAGDNGDEDYETLIIFNYKADDDSDPVARVWDPETKNMVDNEMLTELYAKHAAYAEVYPSLAITAALYGDQVYFNLANCILSYDIETNEVAVVKEYNTVSGARDKTNPFGGMAFTVTTEDEADFTVENHPIAGMTIKGDGNMYVSIATNFAFISGKSDRTNPASEGYGYEYEESNYNPDYNSYMDYSGYEDMMDQFGYTEEINDNDEFMWTANFVETLSMSHFAGDSHSYEEVTVAPTCGEDGYTENRCKECGAIEADTRVVEEGTACEHHYIEFNETYYTKDDGGSWNTGVCYVCTVCGKAVSEPVEPTGQAATDDAMAEYEEELAIYEAAKESAGHTYVPVDPEWASDNSTVTFSVVECSSVCPERKPYLDCLLDDEMITVTLADEVVAEASVIDKVGTCPEGVTQTYGASGEVKAENGETVSYTITKIVELEPADHKYEDGVCTICGDCSVKRLYGSDRIETAQKIADKLKTTLETETYDAIIIANGDNFADALAGSYLANTKSAPILLYRAVAGMTESNLEYIQNNLSEDGVIYLLGGTAAIPESVEESLADYEIVRLAGSTRFETNLMILEEAGVKDEEILIATGWNFADSLSASATGLPILLVNSVTGTLTEEQIEFFEQYDDNTFTIVGGTAAVSEELEAAIEEIVGEDVGRVYGATREETSVKIAERYFKNPELVVVAYSRNFPDGLCGGPLAYAMNVPLVLTNAGAEAAATEYITENEIAAGYVLGGSVVLSDDTVRTVFDLDSFAVIGEE